MRSTTSKVSKKIADMRWGAIALASSIAFSSVAMAETVQFNRVFALGDSLTDGGAYSNPARLGLIGAGVTNAPAIQYRFLDNQPDGSSRTWAEVLAGQLGINLTPNMINPTATGGTNYAQGGTRVTSPLGIGYAPQNGITTLSMVAQVDRLLTEYPTLNKNDLVILWAGANDGFVQFGGVSQGVPLNTALTQMATEANALGAQVDRLKAAGAKYIVVAMVPDLANTPFGALFSAQGPQGQQAAAVLSALSTSFNNTIKATIAGKDVVVVDVNKLLSDVITNPTRYGFNANALGATACGVNSGATGPDNYYNSSLTCLSTNSDKYLFADGVHPSTRAHQLFGQFAMSGLRAIAQTAALAVAPMVATRQHAQAFESRLQMGALADVRGQARSVGDVQVYGGIEGGWFNTNAQQIEPAVKADVQKYSIGLDRMVSKNALIGGAFSYSNAQSQFGQNTGGFKTTDMIGVAYTTVALTRQIYVNAAVAYGDIDHTAYHRQINLDTTTLTTNSAPQGSYQSYRIGTGLNYDIAQWKGGPYLSLTDEKTRIKAFDEASSPAALSFGDVQYHAQRMTLGFMASQTAPLNAWRPFVRASLDRDLKKDDLIVPMGPDRSSLAKVYVPRPDRNTWSANLGWMRPSDDRTVWTILLGIGGTSEQVVAKTIGVSYRMGF